MPSFNRREFFGLLAGSAALALDPEKLLWIPGKKLISIPKSTAILQEFTVRGAYETEGFWWLYLKPAAAAIASDMDREVLRFTNHQILQAGDRFSIAGVYR